MSCTHLTDPHKLMPPTSPLPSVPPMSSIIHPAQLSRMLDPPLVFRTVPILYGHDAMPCIPDWPVIVGQIDKLEGVEYLLSVSFSSISKVSISEHTLV